MKKIITIVILIFIILLSSFYVYSQKYLNKGQSVDNLSLIETKNNQEIENQEVKIGDMILDIPSNIEIETQASDYLVIKFNGHFKDIDIKNNNLFFYINYIKNDSIDDQNIKEWFDKNGPQTEKTSATSSYDEERKINNISYIESLYEAPTSRMASNFYDVKSLYFKNKNDIYEINYYNKSNNSKIYLTPEEINSINYYEKIVNQIINSIRFIN